MRHIEISSSEVVNPVETQRQVSTPHSESGKDVCMSKVHLRATLSLLAQLPRIYTFWHKDDQGCIAHALAIKRGWKIIIIIELARFIAGKIIELYK